MSYAIEIQRTAATLVDITGRSLDVEVFLHTVAPHGARPETLADRVNDPRDGFLPCWVDGVTELVNLDSLAYVAVAEDLPEMARLEETGAVRSEVELVLVTGETVRGELIYEAPRENPRVSELLNRGLRFVVLVTADRNLLVRTAAISRARVEFKD